LTPGATGHFGPEFRREHPLHLPVCGIIPAEESHKLLGNIDPIHVEGEQTAVLAADITSQALQVLILTVLGRAVTFYEGQDFRNERYDAVRIKVVGIRSFGVEVYG